MEPTTSAADLPAGGGLRGACSAPSAHRDATLSVDVLATELGSKLTVSFPGLKPLSPAISPPRSPHISPERPRERGSSFIVYTQRGPAHATSVCEDERRISFDVMTDVAPSGTPRVLQDDEYHRAGPKDTVAKTQWIPYQD